MFGQLKSLFILSISIILITSCSEELKQTKSGLPETILNDRDNYFYVDVKNYPVKDKSLPIGVFDSGTGGLTVLDAIVNFDKFNNSSHNYTEGGDNKLDFTEESFIYLGDKANMPYGEYSVNNKTELLKEHVLKDVQFLLIDKY
jgi:glutamate racemase